MSKLKPGLGRGLDALMNPNFNKSEEEPITLKSSAIDKDDGKSLDILAKIDITKIKPNPFQPRVSFDREALDELKLSILENGLIQPITVRRTENQSYELISGERRLRACREIGHKEIPAFIIQVDTKESMLALALIENIQREKLNPIEVAHAYERLVTECRLSQEDVAKKVGKNRTTITNTLRLLKLPEKIQDKIATGSFSAGHARALINIPSEKLQIKLMDKIIAKELSVRKVEEIIRKLSEKPGQKTGPLTKDSDNIHKVSNSAVEDKLRKILGTKVVCNQKKDGSGELKIEYYSHDEFERLLELFEIIEEYNN
jgi:ParB family chromosome partitioning protein